jgi:fumarate reductase subunit C
MIFLRELTAVFIVAYLVIMLIGLARLGDGVEPYEAFQNMARSPIMVILSLIIFVFTLFHSITFINLIPRGMALRIGEERVHPAFISGPGYIGLVVVTTIVLIVVLR